MARWTVQLVGPLAILRDGVPVKLRTRQQALLLARLVVHAPAAIDRSETAGLLWPDAFRSNALAYLRRSAMELRKLGIDVSATRDELSLEAEAVECDLFDPNLGTRTLLKGIEHPIADEIREIAARRWKRIVAPAPPSGATNGAEAALLAGLMSERPDVALEMMARVGPAIVAQRPPSEVLPLCERTLDASAGESPARAMVLLIAGRAAMLLTRYGLAERYFGEGRRIARLHGDDRLVTRILTVHAFMLLETRQWDAALDMANRAVQQVETLGDPDLASLAHGSLASILWHRLDFERAAEHYRIAERRATTEGLRATPRANLAYLWAVFGVTFDAPADIPIPGPREVGHHGAQEAYLLFSLHLGAQRLGEAAVWAASLLDLTTAEGQERYLCVALDCAAIAFSARGQGAEAGATVRLGSRLRRSLDHGRSPAERLAIRRHVPGGYFAPATSAALAALDDLDPEKAGRRVASRLRVSALAA